MTLNGISKIKEADGDFVILTDYHSEGLAVSHQDRNLQGAIEWILKAGASNEHSIVKLVRIVPEES